MQSNKKLCYRVLGHCRSVLLVLADMAHRQFFQCARDRRAKLSIAAGGTGAVTPRIFCMRYIMSDFRVFLDSLYPTCVHDILFILRPFIIDITDFLSVPGTGTIFASHNYIRRIAMTFSIAFVSCIALSFSKSE